VLSFRFWRSAGWATRLPGYRWVAVDEFGYEGPRGCAPVDTLEALLGDDAFALPYVQLVEQPVHGPFRMGTLTIDDFARLEGAGTRKAIVDAIKRFPKGVKLDPPPGPPPPSLIAEVFGHLARWPDRDPAFRLTVDRSLDPARLHDAGEVFSEFEEFILIEPSEDRLTIVVIGMD
jgi:hypothetical protein